MPWLEKGMPVNSLRTFGNRLVRVQLELLAIRLNKSGRENIILLEHDKGLFDLQRSQEEHVLFSSMGRPMCLHAT